jgi:hypothetical protein
LKLHIESVQCQLDEQQKNNDIESEFEKKIAEYKDRSGEKDRTIDKLKKELLEKEKPLKEKA